MKREQDRMCVCVCVCVWGGGGEGGIRKKRGAMSERMGGRDGRYRGGGRPERERERDLQTDRYTSIST